jgi:hypothetical protein
MMGPAGAEPVSQAPATRAIPPATNVPNEPRAGLTSVAWQARGVLPFAVWVEQGRKLGLTGRSAGWWIGDWLNYGNARYGERYVRAAKITGYDVQTLMNMVYVASHIEPSRRREKLSWSHHAEVVALGPTEQDGWLDRAENDRLSVKCLREALRRSRMVSAGDEDGDGDESPRSRAKQREHVCPSCGHTFEEHDEATAPLL